MFISIWRSFITAQKWRWLGLMAVVFLVLAGTLYVAAYRVFVLDEQVAAQQQAQTGRDSLDTASQQHKPLLYALANDGDVKTTLLTGQPSKLNKKLYDLTAKAGLEALYLMDLTGLTVAASNYQNDITYSGKNYSFRPYFKDAKLGKSGAFFAIGATTGIPGYFISESVLDDQGNIIGVLAAKVSVSAFASIWADGARGLVSNKDRVVILASDNLWLYSSLTPLTHVQEQNIKVQRQFADRHIEPLGWDVKDSNSAIVSGDLFVYAQSSETENGWTLHLLLDPTAVQQKSALVAVVSTAVLLFVWAWALMIRSRRMKQALQQSETSRSALIDANTRLEQEVSERILAQASLGKAQKQLVQTSRMAALGQLSASVIHELGQPLTALNTYLAAAELDNHDVNAKELIANLQNVSKRMQLTTDELRVFSRPDERGQQAIDLHEVIASAVAMAKLTLPLRDLKLDILEPDRQAKVMGHKPRLEQVIINLLSNACSALADMPDPYISIHILLMDDNWCVQVADNGPGFSGQDAQKLFEAFYTTNAKTNGMGLGLAICAAIVEEHHGQIGAQEREGGGAQFNICLPRVLQASVLGSDLEENQKQAM
ncbi:MAG TPA: hypothetical protein DE179_00720 [Oceanospirillaceae bacterium]|nr:hypothetical protein [Oceanospirillaceae bacterium]